MRGLGYIFLIAAREDREASERLSAILRKLGWGVRGGPTNVEGPSADEGARRSEIDGAEAVLILWSANSVTDPRVNMESGYAQARKPVIAVRLDAAAPPLVAERTLDLSESNDFDSELAERGLLEVVGLSASVSIAVSGVAPSIDVLEPGVERPQSRRNSQIIIGLVLGVLVIAVTVLALGAYLPASPGEAGAASASRALADTAEGLVSPEDELGAEWRRVAVQGPAAIRAFIDRHAGTRLVESARLTLGTLDHAAWAGVLEEADAASVLERLSAYRADFPDGAFLEEATVRERAIRAQIMRIQERLRELGLSNGVADGGLDPDTVNAVRRFQREAGMAPTGRIDALLLAALDAAPAGPVVPEAGADPSPAAEVYVSTNLRPVGAVFRDCYVCPELVVLPAGSFVMGDLTGAAPPDERPARTVTIGYRLAVGKYEVTNEEWAACVEGGACRALSGSLEAGKGRLPVGNVSPDDAHAYTAWLSGRTGSDYRLLSEAEWEYAARAGSQSAWSVGNDPSLLCAIANGADRGSTYAWKNDSCSDGHAAIADVGKFTPNAFGLHDMSGNLWEWTADCWHGSYGGAPSDGSAWISSCERGERVLRGGAYSVDVDKLRSSFRYRFAPKPMPFFGFRVARKAD